MISENVRRFVKVWLLLGLVMILFQIILGGITRLTGSGLSITRWDIITGIWFPMSDEAWHVNFQEYKKTPQYLKINSDFSLKEFKFIYFWEYIHRLWARLMGVIFLIPLLFLLLSGQIQKWLKLRLLVVLFLAGSAAAMGWIMVASGLIEHPWVNAYKLSFHLGIAVCLLGYLYWTFLLYVYDINRQATIKSKGFQYLFILLIVCSVQIFIGGIMAGMKASLAAPTWPLINGSVIPGEFNIIFTNPSLLFSEYELNSTAPIFIQFIHRTMGYGILCLCLFILWKARKIMPLFLVHRLWILIIVLMLQIGLGIFTLIYSVGIIPLWYGVLHQFLGMILFLYVIYLLFLSRVQAVER